MEILISLLIGILLLITLIPSRKLFPTKDFKKIIASLNEKKIKKEKVVQVEKSYLNRISIFGLKIMKLFNIKIPNKKYSKIEIKLLQGGLKKRFSVEGFYGLKVGMLLVGGIYGLLLSKLTDVSLVKVICFLIIPVCYIWPDIWIENTIKSRRYMIQKEMPFVLSSIAIVTESGQSLMQAISEVANLREGTLVEEFRSTILEIEMGFSRVDALERMMDRVQVTELSIFLSSLTQSMEKGSSGISDLLKKQSEEMWKKRKEKAKELAAKASIKLFLPLLLFVLPAMMIFLLTPAILSLMTMF